MTEVENVGRLGLVREHAGTRGNIHVLHLVPHSIGSGDFRLHGSTKDDAGRHQYFRERGISYDVFYHRRNVDLLKKKLTGDDLPDYTHIVVDGSFTFADWKHLRLRWPQAKLIFRSHNSELPHRVDTLRALAVVAPTNDMERQAQDKIDARLNRRIFLDRDLAAARFADCIITIETLKSAARYWAWLGFTGELVEVPYFLSDDYVAEIEAEVARQAGARRKWLVAVMSSHPGPVTYHGLLALHQAVTDLGEERRKDWRFRATGRSFWIKNHPAYTPRVKPLGVVDDLYNLIALSSAVAVLSDLGRGFKTKILEAILCKCWVLVAPTLYRRLPDAVRPYCLIVDPESPFSLDEALGRVERKDWPGGDPNAIMRSSAYHALDTILLGEPPAADVKGASFDALAPGHRKSIPKPWNQTLSDDAHLASFCTVLTPVHKKVAAHNWEMVAKQNPAFDPKWHIVDNHDIHMATKKSTAFLRKLKDVRGKPGPEVRKLYLQRAKEEYYDYGEIADYFPGADIIDGLSLDETFEAYAAKLDSKPADKPEHERLLRKFLASYHHASGLNLSLERVRSKYAVVIDPDLYVIRPNWLDDVITHMQEHDLAAFGVPWNPRWYWKYRYFPCTHLMILDLEKCPFRQDILAPDLVRYGQKFTSKFWMEQMRLRTEDPEAARKQLLSDLPRALVEDLKQRRTIAESGDTGYGLIEEFQHNPALRYDSATPVFSLDMGFQPPTVSPLQRSVDHLLPDRFSYLPKRAGSMTDKGFNSFGLPDCRQFGWEEFLWKGEPFAFHVRGELHRKPVGRTDDVQVLNVLNAIMRSQGSTPVADNTWCGADLMATEQKSWHYLDAEMADKRAELLGGGEAQQGPSAEIAPA